MAGITQNEHKRPYFHCGSLLWSMTFHFDILIIVSPVVRWWPVVTVFCCDGVLNLIDFVVLDVFLCKYLIVYKTFWDGLYII